jgi:ribosomal protein L37E
MNLAAAPTCPACGFRVFNRRYPKCESCGAALPESIVYSAVERYTLQRADEERVLEQARNDKPVVDGIPGSFDEAVVSAVLGLTER